MSTLELTDAERLLNSLAAPLCEWGTLGSTQPTCTREAAELCTPRPCGCLPKYFCADHAVVVRRVLESKREAGTVMCCRSCDRVLTHEDWAPLR